MRGTSHAHTWYSGHTEAFAGIKSLGANVVRVVLSGGRWTANSAADVANVISLCKANKLICVLEDHDGQRLFNGTNGIKATAREAAIYPGVVGTPTPTTSSPSPTTSTPTPTTGTPSPTGGMGCSAAYSVQHSWSGGSIGAVTVTAGSAAIPGWKVALVLPSGTSVSNLWNGVAAGNSGTVTVSNAGYNGSVTAGGSTSFGFQGGGSGAGVTVSCVAS